MDLRSWLKRLERRAKGRHHTLLLPDGQEIHYTGEEMLDAVVAASNREEHRLLPYIRQLPPNDPVANLVWALQWEDQE